MSPWLGRTVLEMKIGPFFYCWHRGIKISGGSNSLGLNCRSLASFQLINATKIFWCGFPPPLHHHCKLIHMTDYAFYFWYLTSWCIHQITTKSPAVNIFLRRKKKSSCLCGVSSTFVWDLLWASQGTEETNEGADEVDCWLETGWTKQKWICICFRIPE